MADTVVSLVRCKDYDRARVRQAVARAVALAPGAEQLLQPGATVLLKPNLLSSSEPPDKAVNTHPEFVRAVAELCRERGCKIFIGDSCGSLSSGSTARALEVTGLNQVAAETGAQIVDCDLAPAIDVPVPDGRILHEIRLSRIIREVDVIITLPKLKTHELTLLTGAVKNQLGLVPGKGKKGVHLSAPKPAALSQAMVDIYSVVRPHLAIMDAIVGMEGSGPAAGPPRQVGIVAASLDCVALLDEAIVPGFKRPPRGVGNVAWKLMPAAVARWLFNQVGTALPQIIEERCVQCGECVTNCPTHAMRDENGRIICDHALCISCYCCTEVCDQRAIEMKRPLLGRLLHYLGERNRGS